MTEDESEWARAGYREAEEDIRWGKARATSVVLWSLALFGGLTAIARGADGFLRILSFFAVGLVGGVAYQWLQELHDFGKRSRDYVDRCRPLFPDGFEYPLARGEDPHHEDHLKVQKWVVMGGAVFAWVQVLFGG